MNAFLFLCYSLMALVTLLFPRRRSDDLPSLYVCLLALPPLALEIGTRRPLVYFYDIYILLAFGSVLWLLRIRKLTITDLRLVAISVMFVIVSLVSTLVNAADTLRLIMIIRNLFSGILLMLTIPRQTGVTGRTRFLVTVYIFGSVLLIGQVFQWVMAGQVNTSNSFFWVGSTNYVGFLIVVSAVISSELLGYELRAFKTMVYTMLVCTTAFVLYSGSRANSMALILLYFQVLSKGRHSTSSKLLVTVLAGLLLVSGFQIIGMYEHEYGRIWRIVGWVHPGPGLENVQESDAARWAMYRHALEQFASSPLLGKGFSNTYYEGMEIHSFILELLSGVGLLGTTLYLFLILFAISTARNQTVIIGMLTLLLVSLVQPFLTTGYHSNVLIWLAFRVLAGTSRASSVQYNGVKRP